MERARVKDVVVVVPGILGSRLVKDGNEVWALSGSALLRGIGTLGRSVSELTLPPDLGDGHPDDGVIATGLMRGLHFLPGIGPGIDGYSRLWDWLQHEFTLSPSSAEAPGNLIAFPYDWRLSIRYNAAQLGRVASQALERWREHHHDNAEARLVFLCHSMGGLVVRYCLNVVPDPPPTRAVITMGTPFQGSLDALSDLVNGRRVLGVDLSPLARSLPSLHQLTPAYRCIDSTAGARVAASQATLPGVDPALLADAAHLHTELATDSGAYTHYAIVGQRQPTQVTARLTDAGLVASEVIDGDTVAGDGRVPRFSARPNGSTTIPEIGHVEKHGSLHNRRSVHDNIWTWLTDQERSYRSAESRRADLSVRAPEILSPGAPLTIEVTAAADDLHLRARLHGDDGALSIERTLRNLGEGRYRTTIDDLASGAYRLSVAHTADDATTVTHLLLVIDTEQRTDV